MKGLAIGIILSACGLTVARTQPPAPIKGHVIGESFSEYVSRTKGLAEYLQSCALAVNGKTARKLKVFPDTCSNYAKAAAGATNIGVYLDDDFHKTADRNYFDGGIFSAGRLVQMHVSISGPSEFRSGGGTFSEVMESMVTRFGPPNDTSVTTKQNSYGAKFDYQEARWDKPDFLAFVRQTGTIAEPQTLILLMTKDFVKSQPATAKDVLK